MPIPQPPPTPPFCCRGPICQLSALPSCFRAFSQAGPSAWSLFYSGRLIKSSTPKCFLQEPSVALQASCRYGHALAECPMLLLALGTWPFTCNMGEITLSHSVHFPKLSWSFRPQGGAGKSCPPRQRMSRHGRCFFPLSFLFALWSLTWRLRLIGPGKKDLEAYTETQDSRPHRANSDLRGTCRAVALREQRYAVLLEKDSVCRVCPRRGGGWGMASQGLPTG